MCELRASTAAGVWRPALWWLVVLMEMSGRCSDFEI